MRTGLIIWFFLIAFVSMGVGSWEQLQDFGGEARHRTTGLSIGNKIYLGLGHYNGAGVNILFGDWWEYDPSNGSWTQKADYAGGPCYHATGFTIDQLGYVGTGRTSAVGSTLVQDFFKYDPSTNTWTAITPFIGSGRRGSVSFVIDGIAYLGTGESNGGRTGSFFKYEPSSDTWTQVSSIPGPDRTSSVAFAIDGFGYCGTGDISGGSTNDFWKYDPSSDSWTACAPVGPISRQEATGFALYGKGYIGTGDDMSSGTNYKDFWKYDPITDSWEQMDDFSGTARRYLTSIVHNDVAYCALGTNGTNFKDFWRYDPTASVDKLDLEIACLGPNPCIDFLHVSGVQAESYVCYSIAGKILQSGELYSNRIDLSSLQPGSYVVQIQLENNINISKVIQKR